MAALPDEMRVKVVLDEESIASLSAELLDRFAEQLAPRLRYQLFRRSDADVLPLTDHALDVLAEQLAPRILAIITRVRH